MQQTITVKREVLGKSGLRDLVISDINYKNRTLRPYQQHIVDDHIGKHRYTLTEAPTGSGKTTIMLCHAALCIGQKKKVIITTPQLGINANFRRYTASGFMVNDGQFVLPRMAIPEEPNTKTKAVKEYINGKSRTIIHVCSYAALAKALEDNLLDLSNVVVLIDEAHHSSFGDNSLGRLIQLCLEKCDGVHGFTATAFRSDGTELFNGEFKHFRRTLKDHYLDPYDNRCYCPDFGVYVRFYQEVLKEEFEEFEYSKSLGSSSALIEAYLDEYEQHPLPTIMIVSDVEQAHNLQKAIEQKFKKRILNLGSDDGKTLISANKQKLQHRFAELAKDSDDIDIIIAIQLMREGIDWPICAQTFSPRISSSMQLLMQQAIGRAMRLKIDYPSHPSRYYSRVVLFEIGIKDKDRDLCTKALFELAVRLKAFCEGLDFADDFRFRLRTEERERIDTEKTDVKNRSNAQLNAEIMAELYESAAKGASAIQLAEQYAESRRELGIDLDPKGAMEVLIECGVISEDAKTILQDAFDKLSKKNAAKLNGRLTFAEFRELFDDVLGEIRVIGCADYAQLLSGREDIDKVIELLREHVTSSAERNKQILLEMADNGESRPSCHSTRLGRCLISYICKGHDAYDAKFESEIKKRAPAWFVDTAAIKKTRLIQMMDNKEPRPNKRSNDKDEASLGLAIINYTNPTSGSYDHAFTLHYQSSHWAINQTVMRKNRLKQLIESGVVEKPKRGQIDEVTGMDLSYSLKYYTTEGKSYDAKFTSYVAKHRPQWLEPRENVNANKLELLKLAKIGKKPKHRTKLSRALQSYTSTKCSSYDQAFTDKIEALQTTWISRPKNYCTQDKKLKLLQMAKDRLPRPTSAPHADSDERSLASLLIRSTNHSYGVYDEEFDRKIRKLAPQWFIVGKSGATKKKEVLLSLAEAQLDINSGASANLIAEASLQPRQLINALGIYTRTSHSCYDPVFDAKIRKLCPDWFKK